MRNVFRSSRAGLAAAALSAALATGCATTSNPDDPLEGYNRAMFSFNEQLDKVAIKPAAQVYEAVLPQPVRTGVGNVLGNLGDPWIGLNNLLQGKVAEGMSDLMRFALNSTWGLLGEQYVGLEAGADTAMLKGGDRVLITQSAVVLEKLIGQFMFDRAADAPAQ